MVSIYDVNPRKLIEELAKELQKMPEMAPPEWATFVKTGVQKDRPPADDNWWYIRSASVLRAVYKLGPIGVSKLRTKYGGRKNRGYKPDKTFKASGNIIRKILQKLELVGFMKQTEVGVHKGRTLTPKGKSFVDKIVGKTKLPHHAKKTHKEDKQENIKDKKPETDAEAPSAETMEKSEKKAKKKEAEK